MIGGESRELLLMDLDETTGRNISMTYTRRLSHDEISQSSADVCISVTEENMAESATNTGSIVQFGQYWIRRIFVDPAAYLKELLARRICRVYNSLVHADQGNSGLVSYERDADEDGMQISVYLKRLIRKKVESGLGTFKLEDMVQVAIKDIKTAKNIGARASFIEEINDKNYSKYPINRHKEIDSSLLEDRKRFRRIIGHVLFPNTTASAYMLDICILLASSFYMDGLADLSTTTEDDCLFEELEKIACILYVNIQYSAFINRRKSLSYKKREIHYLYHYFKKLKSNLTERTEIFIRSHLYDRNIGIDTVKMGEFDENVFDLLDLFSELPVDEMEKTHLFLTLLEKAGTDYEQSEIRTERIKQEVEKIEKELEKTEREQDRNKDYTKIKLQKIKQELEISKIDLEIAEKELEEGPWHNRMEFYVTESGLKKSLFLEKLKTIPFHSIVDVARIVDGTVKKIDSSSEDSYAMLKDRFTSEKLEQYKRFNTIARTLTIMFYHIHMSIWSYINISSTNEKVNTRSIYEKDTMHSTIAYKKDCTPAIKKIDPEDTNLDPYTKQAVVSVLEDANRPAQMKIEDIGSLQMFDKIWVYFCLSIIPLLHLVFFISSWYYKSTSVFIDQVIEYFIHLLINIVFSAVICVYGFRLLKSSCAHRKKYSFAYNLMSKGFSQNRFILFYLSLFLISLFTATGSSILLILHREEFFTASMKAIQTIIESFSPQSSLTLRSLSISRILLVEVFIIQSATAFYWASKERPYAWLKSRKIVFLAVLFLSILSYFVSLGYSSIYEVSYAYNNYHMVVYNYHIGIILFLLGLAGLTLYPIHLSINSKERFANLLILRSLKSYKKILIALLATIVLVSGVGSIWFLHKHIFDKYSIFSELEKNNTTALDPVLPIP